MQNCGDFVDFNTIDNKDLDLARVAVKAQDRTSRNKNVPTDRLVRYNFLEVFIRLAGQKYDIKVTPWDEIIRNLSEEYLQKHLWHYDCHLWRKKFFWREECDLAIKR